MGGACDLEDALARVFVEASLERGLSTMTCGGRSKAGTLMHLLRGRVAPRSAPGKPALKADERPPSSGFFRAVRELLALLFKALSHKASGNGE
jgi:hypothetical protein